jgi:AcrR family transcriptional regulator
MARASDRPASRRKRPARETYHHGNLRRALIEAALKFVRDGGPDAFTMAEAAREAGVSSGAPYRHFPDRKALMRAVAAEGEELLAEAMDQAIDGAGADGWSRLLAVGRAQVAFAQEHAAHFRVLYSPEYRTPEDAGYQAEVDTNRTRLLAAHRSREAAAVFAAQCAIYGLSRMVVDGQLGPELEPEVVDDALRAVLNALRGGRS